MVYRITPQHYAANTIRYSQLHHQNMAVYQSQISTGLEVQKPSDDPSGISAILANKANVRRIDVDMDNIAVARSKLNQSVAQLLSAKEALSRANARALEGVQAQPDERATIAQEVDGILQLMLQIANATDGGKPLYAGTSQTLEAFQIDSRDADGRIASVAYRGSADRSRIVIGVERTVDALFTGSEVFQARGRAEHFVVGATGAAAGLGTDSVTGFGTLEVRHTSTTISGASGLQNGLSVAQNTAIGQHTLQIDGVEMTISLDGGTPVPFVKGDQDVRVVAPGGTTVYLDTSAFVDGFVGSVDLQGDGTLSIDGGLTTVPIDFTQNQMLTHSLTGKISYIDSRDINRAGDDSLEYPETSDVFTALIQLRDELLNRRGLTGSDWTDAMARRVSDIQRVHDQLLEVIGEQSVSLENLEGLQARAEEYQLETQLAIADRESVDVAAAIVELQSEQNLLQYTYAVSANIMGLSILDFLR